MHSRVVVPVQLGCCPDLPRCRLCNPPPDSPTPEKVEALISHYRSRAAGADLEVRFFGGRPPPEELLEVCRTPFSVRVRPDLLSRAEAERLIAAGCEGIELDLLSFDDGAVRAVGRSHRRALVIEQATELKKRGVRIGGVLAPGLPGTAADTCLDDARLAAGLLDTVRIHPVLVLESAGLREAHMDGRYEPLGLGDAVTVIHRMLDVLEPSGVEVIRVGQQPAPDELGGRAVAGPAHPSLRELVEARRALEHLQALFHRHSRPGSRVSIRCAPADVARVRGPHNQHVRTLRADHGVDEVHVRPDPRLPRGSFEVEVA